MDHLYLNIIPRKYLTTFSVLVFVLVFFSCKKNESTTNQDTTTAWNKVLEDCDSLIFNNQKENAKKLVFTEFRKIKNPTVLDSCNYYRFWQWLYKDIEYNYDLAMDYNDSMRMVIVNNKKEKDYASVLASIYYVKGDILFATGDYKEAYNAYFLGKDFANYNYSPCELTNFHYRLGMVLYKQERYEQSLNQFFESLQFGNSCNQNFSTTYRTQEIIDNIGLCYFHLNKMDSALYYYQKGIHFIDYEIPKPSSFQDTLLTIAKGVIYGNMGSVYEHMNNDSAAIDLYKLNISINNVAKKEIVDALKTELKLANIYLKNKQHLNFWYSIENCRKILLKNYDPRCQQQYYEIMANHLLERDSILALQYFLKSKRLNDSLEIVDRNIKSIDLKNHINELEKEHEIQELQKTDQQRTTFLSIAITVSLIAILVIFFIFFYMKRLRKFLKLKGKLNSEIFHQKTELEKALHKLEIAYREKDKILNIVAHDLRSPINSILALTDLLLQDDSLKPDQKEPLQLIVSACQNSLGLSKEILESAILMQSKELNLNEININELLAHTVSLLRFRAGEKQIQLDLQLTHIQYHLILDKDKIQRVFNNLITNAIKFSRHDSTIYIAMKKEKDGLVFSFKDFGIGIPEKIQNIIFDMFTEAKREGTDGEKAYGLGLSISKQIVEIHQGDIWFESKEGNGTTFYIYLPFSFKAPEL